MTCTILILTNRSKVPLRNTCDKRLFDSTDFVIGCNISCNKSNSFDPKNLISQVPSEFRYYE